MMGSGWGFGDWVSRIRGYGFENVVNRFYSTYAAKVEEVADPQQQGRIQVRVHSLGLKTKHDRFAYPVSPYAGTNHGLYLPPHADESVWVSFDHGDINGPRVVGGWWRNADENKKPSSSYLPPEFVDNDGKAPTRRGLKTRYGHGFLFEDEENSPSVQFWTGKTETETVQGEGEETKEVVKVGEWAEKHNIIWLDDHKDTKQVVIATFGLEKDGAETSAPADELPRARFEREFDNRLRNMVKLSDAEGQVLVRTIGDSTDDSKKHILIMSDKDKQISLTSNEEHHFLIHDEEQYVDLRMKDDFGMKINQKDKKIVVNTVESNVFTQDDAAGTKIETEGAFDLSAKKASTHEYDDAQTTNISGDLTVEVGGSWMQKVKAAASLLIDGALKIEGQSVSIKSSSSVTVQATGDVTVDSPNTTISSGGLVTLGAGAQQNLMNEIALNLYNAHTHNYIAPLLPLPGPTIPSEPPLVPLVKGVATTVSTKAG